MKSRYLIIALSLMASQAQAQIYNHDGVSVGLPQGGSIGSFTGSNGKSHGYTDVEGPLGFHYYTDDSGQSCTSVPTNNGGTLTNCAR